ncbi:MAG: 4-hydroxy-3-methylbut-2-enyl diphosphate reductase [Verrucomicrobiales bacterium]
MSPAATPPKPKKVNVRTPEVMERVQAQVESHYRSEIVEKLRERGGVLTVGNTTLKLARQFGFCYGVERAIDLAYAARKVFSERRIHLIGEIIHNPEVNRQLREMEIEFLPNPVPEECVRQLGPEDVVIVPAFGAETRTMRHLEEQGCTVVDTTCGDVMSVWRRVRDYANSGFTSIIHGKAQHEETRATASRAQGPNETGRYLIILTLADCDYVCEYIRQGGDKKAFLEKFANAHSPGFDPDTDLHRVGVANQTTMLKSETEEMQRRLAQAIADRDGPDAGGKNFVFFDTICGATQERQDALFAMLEEPMDLLLVVGGYNSSNTSHLVEIGVQKLPTFFIRNQENLRSLEEIVHFDLHSKTEKSSYARTLLGKDKAVIGITAGASCPNNLIEETIFRVFELRGVPREQVLTG